MIISLLVFTVAAFIVFHSEKSRAKKLSELTGKNKNKLKIIKEIRYQDKLYDVTNWVDRHPGGKVIEFYTSSDEDASIAIQQFHNRSSKKVLAILHSFKSRPVPEKTLVTQKDLKNDQLTEDFYKLFEELQDEGKFQPSLVYAALRIAELIFLCALGMTFVIGSGGPWQTTFGIIILNLFQMRCGFFMHEAGHCSITGWPSADWTIETLVMGIGDGLSGSWWRSQHNRHHAMPQRLDHDADLKTLPLVAFNLKVMKGKLHAYNSWVRHQAKLMVPLTALIGQLSWKIHLHPMYALRKRQYLEFVAMAIHYYGAYQIGFVNFLLVEIIFSSAMLVTFSVSHSHLPVTEEPSHWVEYSTIHTMNVNPSWWCDYWMGYLNYQIEHHLFPTMPQFRLREISGRVQALIEKNNLPYTCVSYGTAVGKLFNNLSVVAKDLDEQAKLDGIEPYWTVFQH